MADRFGEAGAQPQKQPHYAPIFIAASLTGVYTQRHVFHDPSNVVTQRFYGGRPDTLWDGLNIELSNELTLIRRFGSSQFSATTYPQAPTCGFSFEHDDGTIQVIIDTPGVVYVDNQDGTKTTIFTKSAGAGQGYFVSSGNVLYYGDGVDTLKYTPANPNGTSWNWGIVAPVNPPTITITESGASATQWQANTYFTTMGLLFDGTNIQQLYTVNANGLNPGTQFGTSSNGQPAWNQTPGGTTTDGGVTWTNQGVIGPWLPSTTWQSGQCIYVLIGSIYYLFISTHNFPTTSGASAPIWNTALLSTGARTNEFNAGGTTAARWGCLGAIGIAPSMVQPWAASAVFAQYVEPSTGSNSTTNNNCTIEPTLVLPPAAGQNIYLQAATTGGTTGSGSTAPTWATSAGLTTNDGNLGWRMVSSGTWAATHSYAGWFLGAQTFGAVKVTVSGTDYFQVCIQGGVSGTIAPGTTFALTAAGNASGGNTSYTGTFSPTLPANYPVVIIGFVNGGNNVTGKVVSCSATTLVITNSTGTAESASATATFNQWGTSYGAVINDGTAAWVCVGQAVTWAANQIWHLPTPGFAPPTTAQPYGGSSVIANNDVQFVISSGKSNSSAPSWGAIGSTTSDNGITWYTTAAYSQQSLSWTIGHNYAYSYKARTPTDTYVTNVPPGGTVPFGPYLGSGTGGISTASPAAVIVGGNAGAVNTISGFYSADPQVDTIVIWRDADGGGPDNMFELTEIPNLPTAPAGTLWSFDDFLPDVPTSAFPGLNNLIPAPIDESNDPPPTGFRPLCNKLHFSRIWGAVANGNTVFNSGGPDVLTGNPNEAFDPTDDFPFQSTVIACIHTPSGLICPTTTDFECIYGGPSTGSFFDTTMLPGVGMLSYNAWDVYAGEIYFVSSDSQMWALTPATQLARTGFAVGNKIAAFSAASVYLTVHESGTDNAIYVGDGSTQWYRMNPHQVGADIGGENVAVWSPRAAITGGVQMLQSLVTAPGLKKLLIGGTGTNQHIQKRDTTVFADSGSAYSAWFDIGAITMVYPGQRAAVKFIEMDFMPAGTQPTVSRLLDDPTASPSNWIALTNYVFDPPIVYAGASITPNYWPDRFYLSQTADVAVGRRIRIKVDYGNTDTVRNELISFAIFGKKYVEQ